jgi:hypothetical protein
VGARSLSALIRGLSATGSGSGDPGGARADGDASRASAGGGQAQLRAAAVLARRDVKAKAGATVTAQLKPSAAVRRKLRHGRTPATLGLTEQSLNRWVTLTG